MVTDLKKATGEKCNFSFCGKPAVVVFRRWEENFRCKEHFEGELSRMVSTIEAATKELRQFTEFLEKELGCRMQIERGEA